MGKKLDLKNKKFGRLTVISESVIRANDGKVKWDCICDCGKETTVVGTVLVSGHTTSCGCKQKEVVKKRSLTHGMTGTPTHKTWEQIKQRTQNKNNPDYHHYGGRGIKICSRWSRFENFLEDMGKRPEGMSIDRIDNNKGYFKENCRWADQFQQTRNTRVNRLLTFKGKTLCVREWEELLNFNRDTISNRINRYGWSVEKALTTV